MHGIAGKKCPPPAIIGPSFSTTTISAAQFNNLFYILQVCVPYHTIPNHTIAHLGPVVRSPFSLNGE
jgi:hypothetical protein